LAQAHWSKNTVVGLATDPFQGTRPGTKPSVMAFSMRTLAFIASATLAQAQASFRGFRLPLFSESPVMMDDQHGSSSIMSFSSSSVLGEDGRLHTETHKVETKSSSGLEQRTEVTCKDGDCSQTMSIMGRMSSMVPPCVRARLSQMHELPSHAHNLLNSMRSFSPEQSPRANLHFLAPISTRVVFFPAEKEHAPQMAPTLSSANASHDSLRQFFVLMFGATIALIMLTYMIITAMRSCCGKQQMERPMQALGEPLVDSAAELGLAGTAIPRSAVQQARVQAAPSKPTEVYLFDLYSRAGAPQSEAELASILLRGIYTKAA